MFRNTLLLMSKHNISSRLGSSSICSSVLNCSVGGGTFLRGTTQSRLFSNSSNSSNFVQKWRQKYLESNANSSTSTNSSSSTNSSAITNSSSNSILQKPLSTSEVISNNLGLSKFIKKVYLTSGLGITGSLGTAWILSVGVPAFIDWHMPHFLFGGLAIGITGCVGLGLCKYTISEDKTESINSNGRLASFGLIVGGTSLMITPICLVGQIVSPMILPIATLMSLVTMGGATAYAYYLPPDKLLKWEGPVYAGLLGICGVGLSTLGSLMIFGPNSFASLLHSVDVYGGILLFTCITAYETQLAVSMYQKGNPDHLGCATNVFLDFVNLLVRYIEILIKSRK